MKIDEKRDVFISYHGGGDVNDETKSSYKMADDLRIFLEKRGVTCFLCKKENESDFYEAIDKGIKNSDHFVLVACNRTSVEKSIYVRDEIKQFDGLYKLGRKPNCLISACIFGSMTEDDLIDINSMFSTKEVVRGREGFERLYQMILEKNQEKSRKKQIEEKSEEPVASLLTCTQKMSAEEISREFLDRELVDYNLFSEEEYLKFCENLTERLKCMTTNTIKQSCENIVEEQYNEIIKCIKKSPYKKNIMNVSGSAGTQKSYVLQLLYVCFRKKYEEHNFEPIYIHCDLVRKKQKKKKEKASEFFKQLQDNLVIPEGRQPIFIVDGLTNIVIEDESLDFAAKKAIDSFDDALCIVGVNSVFEDNVRRKTQCSLVIGRYEINMKLSPISLYDKEKCIRYIKTLSELPIDDEEKIYKILNSSGLFTIDEFVIRKLLEWCDGCDSLDLMNIFENEIINILNGDEEMLQKGAAFIFDFAYGTSPVDFNDDLHEKILLTICSSPIYLNCLMAIHFCNQLEVYRNTMDWSFFRMVWPKEVTRFIIKKINKNSDLENIVVSLAEHYNEMTPLGKSEISFLLGRIKAPNAREKAIRLLEKYYNETKELIKRKIIDNDYNNKLYSHTANKQDLFLLRGLSVSLIYCGKNNVLYEYLNSLISDDLANSINRGFHLEYYGDKRYLPGQDMLDYEDNIAVGQRTLRILCNSIENQLKSNVKRPAMLLELFTVASLIQVRIEVEKSKVSFSLTQYIDRFCDMVNVALQYLNITDNTILSFFKMVLEDFNKYKEKNLSIYSPKRDLCNQYLCCKDVKRAGWVMQNIDDPESIMEHMYACWFIGLVFLPRSIEGVLGYDKQKILNMLIIHDLAETILEDIPKYEKVNYVGYDLKENETMLSMLLKGTYEGMSTLDDYVDAWGTWYEKSDINALIAKDIDTVQAIYQFLLYYLKSPKNFSTERVINWLKEIREIRTEIGEEIVEELIHKNEMFRPILEEYHQMY